jgi:hypothetical protein
MRTGIRMSAHLVRWRTHQVTYVLLGRGRMSKYTRRWVQDQAVPGRAPAPRDPCCITEVRETDLNFGLRRRSPGQQRRSSSRTASAATRAAQAFSAAICHVPSPTSRAAPSTPLWRSHTRRCPRSATAALAPTPSALGNTFSSPICATFSTSGESASTCTRTSWTCRPNRADLYRSRSRSAWPSLTGCTLCDSGTTPFTAAHLRPDAVASPAVRSCTPAPLTSRGAQR